MAGQHELRRHLVELHQLAGDQRIVLAVDRAGLQRRVEFGIGDGRRIGAERLAEELPELAGRHAQLDAVQVGRRLDHLVRLQVDVARAEIDRRDDLDAELIPRHLDEFLADIALERLLQVVGVAEQIGRGQAATTPESAWRCRRARDCRDRGCRAASATSSVPCLNRVLPQYGSKSNSSLMAAGERLVGLRAQIGFGECAAEPELGLALGLRASHSQGREAGCGSGHERTSRQPDHFVSSSRSPFPGRWPPRSPMSKAKSTYDLSKIIVICGIYDRKQGSLMRQAVHKRPGFQCDRSCALAARRWRGMMRVTLGKFG